MTRNGLPGEGFGRRTKSPRRATVVPALFMLVAGLLSAASGAAAQTLPPSIDPGRVERRFDTPSAPPPVGPVPAVDAPEPGAAPDGAEAIRFVLEGVTAEGATVYPPEDLADLWADRLGTSVSLADLHAIAGAVTARYRADGWILSQAVVPAQTIEGGRIRLQVVEGFVAAVDVRGAPRGGGDRIAALAAPILAARPLHGATLERSLLLMNDLPGLTVRGVLAPAEGVPGGARLDLLIEERRFDIRAQLDNRGTDLLGPYQTSVAVGLNSLMLTNERIDLQAVAAGDPEDGRELAYGSASIRLPVGHAGTIAAFAGSLSRTAPGGPLAPLDVEGQAWSLTVSASHPVIRSRVENLYLSAQLDLTESETEIFGSTRLSRDRLTVLRASALWNRADALGGVTVAEVIASRGIEALGASDAGDPTLSRAAGRPDFLTVRGTVSRLQGLGPLHEDLSLLVAATGQRADGALLAAEEFGLGGEIFGRGFDPSEVTGDDGLAVRVELRWTGEGPGGDRRGRDRQAGGDLLGGGIASALDGWQIYGFADAGRVWNRDPATGDPTHQSLVSAGIGLRLDLAGRFGASAELAKPINRIVSIQGNDDWRGFFRLRADF